MKSILATSSAILIAVATTQAATVIVNQGDPNSNTHTNHAGPIYGQSITTHASAQQVLDVTFQIRDGSGGQAANDTLAYLHIYDSVTFNTADGSITAFGNLVGISTNTQNIGANATDLSAVQWNFSNTAVAANTEYYFITSTSTNAGQDIVSSGYELVTGNPYADGRSFASNNFFNTSAAWDLNFSASFDTEAIPEPSSTALLGLAGLALIMRRRK
ncbi:PEP-CTERM sorting domain-containing protein [Rubritalea tangerina]|uniref:PEP-CTERM sorting domain-containing protein n=1 Tax=Rubritalea tangerina TaxID=430798 RepID=A0ABW4Z7E1_9BACT